MDINFTANGGGIAVVGIICASAVACYAIKAKESLELKLKRMQHDFDVADKMANATVHDAEV